MNIVKAHIEDYDAAFYADAFRYLTDERQQRALRFRNASDRHACILGDALLRNVVAEELGCDYRRVCIGNDSCGKPYVVFPSDCGLNISLSHSDGMVVAALDEVPIGIDVECIRDIDARVLKHVLSENEALYVGESNRRFFEIWTMKEAYLKCIGLGLAGCKQLKDLSVFALPEGYSVKVIDSSGTFVLSQCRYFHALGHSSTVHPDGGVM